MNAPRVSVDASAVLVLVGLGVLGVLGWRAYVAAKGTAGAVIDAAGQAWDGAVEGFRVGAARAVDAITPDAMTQPATFKPVALLYSDYGYSGEGTALDAYEKELAALSEAYEQQWRKPAAVSPSGAAFGIYPKP